MYTKQQKRALTLEIKQTKDFLNDLKECHASQNKDFFYYLGDKYHVTAIDSLESDIEIMECRRSEMDNKKATAEQFFALAENAKLTKPQRETLDRLKSGCQIWIYNKHHSSGGQCGWKEPYYSSPRGGGKICKLFYNLVRAVLLDSEYVTEPPEEFFYHNNKEV